MGKEGRERVRGGEWEGESKRGRVGGRERRQLE